jgi:hypothetical protein
MYRQPQGWQALTLCVLGAIFYSVANATDWLAPTLLAIVCWTFGIAILLWIALEVIVSMYAQAKAAMKLSTRAVELERASKLTDEQAKAVPAIAYQAIMAYHLSPREDWVAYLVTKDGHIPFEWTQQFLIDSSSTRLRSIRSYVNGSQAQHYAQWFTAWLRDRAYVVGGEEESGKVAQWLDIGTYYKVRTLFRVGLDDNVFKAASTADDDLDQPPTIETQPAPGD